MAISPLESAGSLAGAASRGPLPLGQQLGEASLRAAAHALALRVVDLKTALHQGSTLVQLAQMHRVTPPMLEQALGVPLHQQLQAGRISLAQFTRLEQLNHAFAAGTLTLARYQLLVRTVA